MVKLTESFIKRKYLYQLHKTSMKVEEKVLKKLTHLFMNEQFIDEIDDFSTCKNLKVIYLQKNFIQKIKNLDFATNLTHLYLQFNEITKIENLGNLVNLRKLYLGYNSISVIEGLQNLRNLSDLYIEKQKLAAGEKLCFNPKTANTLSGCLMYLNISDNQLTSLSDIRNFKQLITLEAQNNLINDIEDLTETICSLDQLENLFLQGNPITKVHRYRENLIANSNSLTTLDKKSISDRSREFLKRFKIEKLQQSRKKLEFNLDEDIANALNLPPAFSRSVSRAMFNCINPEFSFSGISMEELQLQLFPPWKSAISIKSLKDNQVLPRPFWKNKTKQKNIEK